jgi:hypothetical protein
MKKLHLQLDALNVESFVTADGVPIQGTVAARSQTYDNACATAVETYCGQTAAGTACAECENTVMVLTCRATGRCCDGGSAECTNGTGPICCDYTNGTGSLCC